MNLENIKQFLADLHESLLELLNNPMIYYQAALILIIFAVAYLTSKLINSKVKIENIKNRPYSAKWFIKRAKLLVFPIITILLLALGEYFAAIILAENDLIKAVQRVAVIWLLWVMLHAFIINAMIKTVGAWILLPAALLQLFGIYDIVAARLNSYGFNLGATEITLYTFLKAILFVCVILWIGKILSNSGESYIRRRGSLNSSSKELLVKLFDIFLYALLLLTAMNLIGLNLTSLAVLSGAIGVGLGFGLQKIAANFISGIILLSERSVNIDNLIELDDGTLGYVRKLGARATIIETFDGKEVMVPNEDFITSRVANLTHKDTRGRVDVMIGVSYDADIKLAKKLIIDSMKACKDASIKEGSEPKCFLVEYGDNSVNFHAMFWLDDVTTGKMGVKDEVMFNIWDKFKQHKIEIPFPQRDLHIRSGLENLENLVKEKKSSTKKPEAKIYQTKK